MSSGAMLVGCGFTWQSMRSVMPPWPGMLSPKSLILKPRLKPLAKKPPNGAITLAKSESICKAEAAFRAQLGPQCKTGLAETDEIDRGGNYDTGTALADSLDQNQNFQLVQG